jgi:hypothetical protein
VTVAKRAKTSGKRSAAKPKPPATTTPAAKAKAKAKATSTAKPKVNAKPKHTATDGKVKEASHARELHAAPAVSRTTSSTHARVAAVAPSMPAPEPARRPRATTARERATRALPVVDILDDPHPIGALRRFLDSVRGNATEPQAQIALGSAQLLLLPTAREHRGGHEVKELVDLVLARWDDLATRGATFHAQEFLKHALAAIGVDRDRIAKLATRVPAHASAELWFALSCAHAVARDKVAMLHAVDAALDAGASTTQFRDDPEFAAYRTDPDLAALLARAEVPPIPVDVDPHIPPVRRAIDSLAATLRELGLRVELRPPVRLDAILDAERARKISLPNDYRALLTVTNGMRIWDHEFFGAGDYRDRSRLALRAQTFLHEAASNGATGVEDCVPVASWGQAEWLLYDPRGRMRHGEPGYVVLRRQDEIPLADLIAALARIEEAARDALATN